MRILSWLLRAFIFFTLFAFALNNQHTASVHWFFGVEWRAPMVFVVLAAFAAGCALGAAAMLPGWWKNRRAQQPGLGATAGATQQVPQSPSSNFGPSLPGAAPARSAGGVAVTAPRSPGAVGAKSSSGPPSDFGADHPSRLGV